MKTLKIFLLCIISLFAIIIPLNCEPTFMNSYPYQDLFPPSVWSFNSYCCNVIPAIGGGFLLEVHMEPCWDLYSEPQAMFFKISESGVLEWRKCLWDPDFFDYPTYFNSIISNGTDRYYGVGGDTGDPIYFYELDEYCNVLTYKPLTTDTLGVGKINSIKLVNDGIIMAGECYFTQKGLILKTDFQGNTLWHKIYKYQYLGSYGTSEFNSIINTNEDCFLTCGYGRIFNPNCLNGILVKYNSVGDTIWTAIGNYCTYINLIEYTNGNYYIFSFDNPTYGSNIYIYDNNGSYVDSVIFTPNYDYIIDNERKSNIMRLQDNNIIILYNTIYGEIHKMSSGFDILWCRDYLDNNIDESWIGIEEYKILETDNGDLVYCGTTEEYYQDPELILIRTNPDGLDIDDPQSQAVNISTYPNPFSTTTTISFSGKVNPCELQQIKIYNIKGQLVRELLPVIPSLDHSVSVVWDGKDMDGNITAPGVYFYSIEFEDTDIVRKMVKLR